MTELFRNTSPGALTFEQAVERAKKLLAERRRQMQKARELAAQGRGEDTEIAHVARGEFVIPEALQTPELMAALSRAAEAHNIPLERFNVGNALNSINPATGMPEFGVKDWLSELFGNSDGNTATQLPPEMPIPPGASVSENIQEAQGRWNPFWFRDQVQGRPGEKDYRWDYKQAGPQYEPFGNFNYGATGKAFGFPDWILKRAAGWQSEERSGNWKPEFDHWYGKAPYGDDPRDQEMIQKGIDYYKKGGR